MRGGLPSAPGGYTQEYVCTEYINHCTRTCFLGMAMSRVVFPTAIITHYATPMSGTIDSVVLEVDGYGAITLNQTIPIHMARVSGVPCMFAMDVMLTTDIPSYSISVTSKDDMLWNQLHQLFKDARVITHESRSTFRISPITHIAPELVLDASRITVPCTVIRCTRTQQCQRVVAFRSAHIDGTPVHALTLFLSTGSMSVTVHDALAQHMLRSCTLDTCCHLYTCNDATRPDSIAAADIHLPIARVDELDAEIMGMWGVELNDKTGIASASYAQEFGEIADEITV